MSTSVGGTCDVGHRDKTGDSRARPWRGARVAQSRAFRAVRLV